MKKIVNANKIRKGFTLIELLVAMAIISLLTSIVLASLNEARKKATDGNIKSQLTHIRSQISNFYATYNTYQAVCYNNNLGINGMILAAAKQAVGASAAVGADTIAWNYTNAPAVCHDTDTGYAIMIALKKPATANSGWCIDSTLTSKEATQLTSNGINDTGAISCGN